MFGSSILDIAIGIIFVFLLLSVFATAINEILMSLMSMRGKVLLRGIQSLLDDAKGNGLTRRIYTHGQIYGLFEGPFDLSKPRNLPSYIPARNFAFAFVDAIKDWACEQTANPSGILPALPPEPPSTPESIQNPAPQTAPDPSLANLHVSSTTQTPAPITQEFKDAALLLAKDSDKLGKPLLTMIHLAGNDAEKLRQSIEDWYNSGMDRASGWYKYHTQWILFYIGLTIAVILNANTINIVRQLSKDPTLRQAMVAAATAKPSNPPGSVSASPPAEPDVSAQLAKTHAAFDNVTDLGIPLGWQKMPDTLHWALDHKSDWLSYWNVIYNGHTWTALFGWLLTAVAISLGAPFWFDTLNKIMVVRSTIKPHEKSREEGSKDRKAGS
jgi:hypothetical protein